MSPEHLALLTQLRTKVKAHGFGKVIFDHSPAAEFTIKPTREDEHDFYGLICRLQQRFGFNGARGDRLEVSVEHGTDTLIRVIVRG